METHSPDHARFLQPGELDLVTNMLVLWCEKHARDQAELLRHSSVILERWREGYRDENALFEGL